VKHYELIIQNNRIIHMHKQQDKNVQLVGYILTNRWYYNQRI